MSDTDKINFRDGLSIGIVIGFILHYLYFRHIDNVTYASELDAMSYYEGEYVVNEDK